MTKNHLIQKLLHSITPKNTLLLGSLLCLTACEKQKVETMEENTSESKEEVLPLAEFNSLTADHMPAVFYAASGSMAIFITQYEVYNALNDNELFGCPHMSKEDGYLVFKSNGCTTDDGSTYHGQLRVNEEALQLLEHNAPVNFQLDVEADQFLVHDYTTKNISIDGIMNLSHAEKVGSFMIDMKIDIDSDYITTVFSTNVSGAAEGMIQDLNMKMSFSGEAFVEGIGSFDVEAIQSAEPNQTTVINLEGVDTMIFEQIEHCYSYATPNEQGSTCPSFY